MRYDQLLNSSSAGPPPEMTPAGTKPTGNKGDLVTFTCPNGYNFHSRAGPHVLALTCGGFKEGWQYPEDLDPELHGEPLQCVFGECVFGECVSGEPLQCVFGECPHRCTEAGPDRCKVTTVTGLI